MRRLRAAMRRLFGVRRQPAPDPVGEVLAVFKVEVAARRVAAQARQAKRGTAASGAERS